MAAAWILNLDAEEEMAARGGYTPRGDTERIVRALGPQAAAAVCAAGDVVLVEGDRVPVGTVGRAWCPTPRALSLLREAGAEVEPAPKFEAVRAANHRAFAASLGQSLPGAAFVAERADLDAVLAAFGDRDVLLKRAFGHAGRGRRRVRWAQRSAADEAWVGASLAPGLGLQVEPVVSVEHEVALHGVVDKAGGYRFRGLVAQEVDARGQWVRAAPLRLDAIPTETGNRLLETGERVAAALAALSYFGPFGVDGYAYRDERGGARRWNILGELNARYTMGWAASAGG